ncbi:MAG: TerC family protein [Candidatus Sericytochromatia bacterium]
MLFIGFNVLVLILLAIDLGFFHKDSHEIKVKEALISSAVWINLIALLFNTGVYYFRGSEDSIAFLTGYLIEKSLSIDNIFVFVMVFAYFKIPLKYQYKILFWGIIGALIMRATMILAGTALIQNFHWTLYIFGALLVITGIKMFTQKEDEHFEPENNPVVKLFKKFMPISNKLSDKFFIRENGLLMATPLFIVLLVIETTDLIFAVDSIPAIFGVTQDPFIVYTSNVFAILGLRALYFALAGIIDKFHYLKYGLSLILVFIGTKMLIAEIYKIPIFIALAVVISILIISVIISFLKPVKNLEDLNQTKNKEKINI